MRASRHRVLRSRCAPPWCRCRTGRVRAPLFLLAAVLTAGRAPAGTTTPQLGPHYFVIVNLSSPEPMADTSLILRGSTGTTGVAHESQILAPATPYREWILQPTTMRVATADYTTPAAGNRFTFPEFLFEEPSSPDTDGDGLHDLGEFIVGTDPANSDSDNDGVSDGAELLNGSNPLDGFVSAVGLVGAQDTPGTAVDVAAISGLAAVADSAAGVVLFDVADPLNPIRIAQVDTPGNATAVAFGPRLLAVADGAAGLAVIDVSDPPDAAILQQTSFGAAAGAIATDGAVGYVGLSDGSVAAVDLPSGALLGRKKIGNGAVQDLAVGHEALYVIIPGTLYTVDLRDGELGAVASTPSSGSVGAGGRRLRVFAGDDRLFATHTNGVNVFSLADPLAPALINANSTSQFGWKQLVPNGSGLAVAAVDPNSTNDGTHDISLYSLPVDGSLDFITTIPTPGLASSVAIYNGLAYVADGDSGLQVANYLAYDNQHQAPTIALSASFPLDPAQAEEGKLVRVSAAVTDDVQVRNVEFLLDGNVVTRDGGFPFEMRFTTPVRAPNRASFTLQARGFDTGDNQTESPVYTVTLVPDATPPHVVRFNPPANSVVGKIDSVLVSFSEPLDLTTATPATVTLRALGADRAAGTADDVVFTPPVFSWRDTTNTIVLGFADVLPPGVYRFTVGAAVTDLAGNPLAAAAEASFIVFGQDDRDRDGVPDDLEAVLSLDPDNPDTDGDGVLDGAEDFDNDGLANAAEILVETDPTNADSNGDGINDGNEDPDRDGLPNRREVVQGLDPLRPDTDDDGWNDEVEVTVGSDPLSRASSPRMILTGRPAVVTVRPVTPDFSAAASGGTFLAWPPVVVARPETPQPGTLDISGGTSFARPPVIVALPIAPTITPGDITGGTFLGQPPVVVARPQTGSAETATGSGTTLAQPPVTVDTTSP